jgi:hypothetical protein
MFLEWIVSPSRGYVDRFYPNGTIFIPPLVTKTALVFEDLINSPKQVSTKRNEPVLKSKTTKKYFHYSS